MVQNFRHALTPFCMMMSWEPTAQQLPRLCRTGVDIQDMGFWNLIFRQLNARQYAVRYSHGKKRSSYSDVGFTQTIAGAGESYFAVTGYGRDR